MDYQDIRTLKILEELEGNHTPSQRYLSNQLNISLGLVNSFLKRLSKKGYFKATSIPKNRVKYILTPKGALEKSRLTYAYVQHSFKFYRDARKKLRNTLKQLDRQGTQSIVFYGAGDLAEIAYLTLQETTIKLVGIVDEEKESKPFFQFKVQAPELLNNMNFDKILITKFVSKPSLVEKIMHFGIKKESILTF